MRLPACIAAAAAATTAAPAATLLADTVPLTPDTLPGISRLTALEDLVLQAVDLEPSCLLDMTTGLTRLHLEDVRLQPEQVHMRGDFGAPRLLRVLGRLTALQVLELHGSHMSPQPMPAYSALTASSNLRTLIIHNSSMGPYGPKADGEWAHVFPAGRKLPHLHRLYAACPNCGGCPRFGPADIASLVSCCPAVRELTFPCAQPDVSLAPLKSLTALTSLNLINSPISPAVIRSELAALTRLRSLSNLQVPAGPSLLPHLAPLTALTGLTRLYAYGIRLDYVNFTNMVSGQQQPFCLVE
jgi:hypothetical protein